MATSSDYCTYYQSQMGGQLRVFRGGLQSGAGLGDVLRGLFRFLLPVALRGLGSFASNTLTSHQAGIPLALAAKGAIIPALSAAAGPSAAPTVSKIMGSILPSLAARAAEPAALPMWKRPNRKAVAEVRCSTVSTVFPGPRRRFASIKGRP